MTKTGKIFLYTGITLATATGLFFLFRKLKQKRDFGQSGAFFKSNKKGNADTERLKKDNSVNYGQNDLINPKFDPQIYAEKLLYSMKGAGTDETEFFDVYEELTTEQAKLVNRYFDEFGIGGKETLAEWVEGDFNGWGSSRSTYLRAKKLIKY